VNSVLVRYAGSQQLLVAQTGATSDLRAKVDAILTVRQRCCLQLSQNIEALVKAVQLRSCLLEAADATQQPRHMCVDLERL
jgi:hypothetical protein